jgi:hypothetical protein
MADVADPIKARAREREHMAPLTNGPNGRDERGRFSAGNQAAVGRSRPFAAQVASLRRAFFEGATAEDMTNLCQMLIKKALAGDLVAARWALLFLIGKPGEPVWPDAIAAMEAAEAQAATPPLPADPEARLDRAARALAAEIRAARGELPDPSQAVEAALEDLDRAAHL